MFDKTSNNTGQQRNKADGFLNIVIIGKDGVEHKLRNGIPLRGDENSLENKILAVIAANPDHEFRVKASVHVVKEVSPDDIDL